MNNDFKAFLQSGDWVDYLNAHDTVAVVNGDLLFLNTLLHAIDDSFGPASWIYQCEPVSSAWSCLLGVLDDFTFGAPDGFPDGWIGETVSFLLGKKKE